jgi:hypothetical protein
MKQTWHGHSVSEKFGWASEPIWEAWVVAKIKMHKENNHD